MENIILDTDMGPDFDDAGALAVLHSLQTNDKANIAAVVSNNKDPRSIAVVDLINQHYNRGYIPIGITKDEMAASIMNKNNWNDTLLNQFNYTLTNYEDAISTYRKVLAESTDNSITIVSIGFLTNIKNLILSKSDSISPLSGLELINKKVNKLVCMGGTYPEGKEYNFYVNIDATKILLERWPGEILFCGYEIGVDILTGNDLVKDGNSNSPVVYAYDYNLQTWNGQTHPHGRSSFDQMAVLAAVEMPENYWNKICGINTINEQGYNTFSNSIEGNHFYLTRDDSSSLQVVELIEKLMLQGNSH